MKKAHLLGGLVILGLSAFSQQIQESSLVVNVEVPVRVFKGGRFIPDLTINDFELLEDGKPQKLEAMYLVNKRSITRREEEKRYAPRTTRNFFLFFEISDYMPKIDEALDFFISEVMVPGDNIVMVTPVRTYRMLSEAIQAKSKAEILHQFREVLRRDAMIGASEYRQTIEEMEKMAAFLSQAIANPTPAAAGESIFLIDEFQMSEGEGRSVDEQLRRYALLLENLEHVRAVDEKRLIDFSKYMKDKEGQKYVYLFYQREFIPRIDPKILIQYMESYQDRPDMQQTISELFEFYRREINFDVEAVKRAFADSSISSHFLFVTSPQRDLIGVKMEESSEDIFSAFYQIAQSGGGFIESSNNPALMMKNAVEASENYYLLYYTPESASRDGKFREITVRVKNKDFRVVHRVGYFAR